MSNTRGELSDNPGPSNLSGQFSHDGAHDADSGTGAVGAQYGYEVLAKYSRDIILFIRLDDGRLLEANAAACAAYGYSREEILGLTIQDLRAPEARKLTAAQMAEADAHGILFETVHQRRDGSTFPVEVSSKGATIEGTRMLMSAIRDITERKRAERALHESEQRWAITLESIGDAVIATDTTGRITFMNSVAERLTGWTREEATLQPVQQVFNIVNETTRQRVENPVAKVLETGRVAGLANHTLLVRKDGTELAIDDSGAPIKDEEGKTQGVVLIFRDITDRRRVEEALRRSEERFAIILQGVVDGITAQRADGQLLYANDAAARMIGFADVQELLATPTRDVVERFDILDETGQPFPVDKMPGRVALQTRRNATATVRFHVKGASKERWSIIKAVPVFDERGQAEMAVNIFQDITPLKQAEQVLTGTLALTQDLYAASHDLAMADTPAAVLQGLLSTHYLRDTSHALIMTYEHPWTAQSEIPESVEALATYARPDLGPNAMPVKAGQHIPTPRLLMDELQLRTHAWVVGDISHDPHISAESRAGLTTAGIRAFAVFPLIANGVNFGMVACYFDKAKSLSAEDMRHLQGLVDQTAVGISNQLSLANEQRARQQAERANALRLRFLGMISHELRTPLQSIKGFTTTLLASDVQWEPDSQREFMTIIDHEADKLTDMIDQLLDLSRIESGSLRIEPKPLSLEAIFTQARAQLDALAAKHVLKFDVPTTLPTVPADAQRVGQVLANLVGNAAKYSPEGTAITLSALREGNSVRVSVTDEGPGITSEDKPYLFEAFRRGNDGRVRQTKGAGLGLAICKGLVEAHGGSIWLQQHDGPGTTISFTLPVAP